MHDYLFKEIFMLGKTGCYNCNSEGTNKHIINDSWGRENSTFKA